MGTVFTPEQQRVIEHRLGGLLVSAAAGSGKTTVMVEQIIQMLMDPEHKVSVDRLLVVTFTKAAAESMKRKLEERLSQELEKDETNEWLAEQIHLVPLASVMTNHAFSLQLVQEYITRIEGVDPGFRVVDGAEPALMKTDILAEVLEDLYSRALTDREDPSLQDFLAFVNAYGGNRQDGNLEALVLRIYGYMLTDPEPFEWLDKAIISLDPDYKGEGSLYEIQELEENEEERIREIREFLLPALRGLREVIHAFDKAYRKEKASRNVLEFNDFEHYALEILNDPAVCDVLRERYEYIFIDEYQDCNRLQETIIQKMARHNEEGTATNVLMVGDVKQSIYRFRQADPSLFTEKYGVFGTKKDTTLISLNKNFRSGTEVIDAVNEIFSSLMRPEVGGIEYGENEKLYAADHRLEEEREGYTTKLLVCHTDSAEKQIKAEARAIGKEILRLKEEKGFAFGDMVILLRSLSGHGMDYFEELQKMGIPVNYASSESFYDTLEVRTILNLLSVIDNPHQDIPLLGVLITPFVGMDEEDLGRIRLARRDGDFFDALMEYAKVGIEGDTLKKTVRFLEQLEGWRELSSRKVIHDLIWKLYLDTGFYLYVSALPEGKLRKDNLDLLLYRSIEFEKGSYSGLYQFLRYVDKMDKSTTVEKDAGGRDNTDAVKIMTIHKSKGLEYPVVFCANLGKKWNTQDMKQKIVLHDKLGIGTELVDTKRHVAFSDVKKAYIIKALKEEMIAEEIRLLYVAMTRAKELLILVGSRGADPKEIELEDQKLSPSDIVDTAKSYLDWVEAIVTSKKSGIFDYKLLEEEEIDELLEDIPEDNDIDISDAVEDVPEKDDHQEAQKGAEWEKLQWNYPGKWRFGIPKVISVSAIKHARMDEVRQDLQEEEEQAVAKASFIRPSEEAASKGALRGTAYHEIMARGDFASLKTAESIGKEIEKIVQEGFLTKEEADLVPMDWVERFGNSDLCDRVIKSDHVVREQPFILQLTVGDLKKLSGTYDLGTEIDEEDVSAHVILQGIIDLYFYEGDEIILADYKTDYVLDEAAIAGYSVQLEIYQMALEAATGKKVREKMLYDVRRGKEIHC